MIRHVMKSKLSNAKAIDFFDFMVNPPPEIYRYWLPKEHHEFHVVKRSKNSPVSDLIYFDQHISPKHRLNFYAVIRLAKKPNRIIYQMQKFGINIPGYLDLKFTDTADGLMLTETIRIGFGGIGKALDPFIRIVFNKAFFEAMNGHHKREWTNLANILKHKGGL